MPFFSTTRPMLMRPITGGVNARPLIMGKFLMHRRARPAQLPKSWTGLATYRRIDLVRVNEEPTASRSSQLIGVNELRVILAQPRQIGGNAVLAALPANTPCSQLCT